MYACSQVYKHYATHIARKIVGGMKLGGENITFMYVEGKTYAKDGKT